jgi:hypothetical protein
MAEIDIDKMLAKSEEKEKKEKSKKNLVFYLSALGAAIIIGIASFFTVKVVMGDPASAYFPLKPGIKYVYNIKGRNPQEWQVQPKTENLFGFDCSVINKVDKGTFLSRQEYYCVDKEQGLARLAYSDNFGQKVKDVFKLLPYRIKAGREFDAGMIKGQVIKGVVIDKQLISTPLGEIEAYRVEYKSSPYYDRSVWYAKDTGIIKDVNNLTAEEMSIISAGE